MKNQGKKRVGAEYFLTFVKLVSVKILGTNFGGI